MLTRNPAYATGPRPGGASLHERARPGVTPAAPIAVIAAHSGLGAGDPRTGQAPDALARAGLPLMLARMGRLASWQDISGFSGMLVMNAAARLEAVAHMASDVSQAVEQAVQSGAQPLVLGGDHSIAAGTWSGAANALGPGGRLGLIWLDAHMDAHVPETTPSGNWHGMPVAHLLGHGVPELTGLSRYGPALHPENICLIGVRSYEPGEARLLERLGVRVIAAEEVARRGFDACFAEALAIACHRTDGFGVSIDLDVFDPVDAPGVGSPVAGGLRPAPVLRTLDGLSNATGFLGLEIAEYNPARDRSGKTARLANDLVGAVFENEVNTQ